jgi:hypothetical protein
MRRICGVHYDALGYPQRGQNEPEGPIPASLEQSAVAGMIAASSAGPDKTAGASRCSRALKLFFSWAVDGSYFGSHRIWSNRRRSRFAFVRLHFYPGLHFLTIRLVFKK